MNSINFITNQSLEQESGGWSGISRGIYLALADKVPVNFVGPIEPRVSAFEKVKSKALRSVGLKGDFYYFSEQRLSKIANAVLQVAPVADFDLFFGATSWLSTDLKRPYATFIDALFPTYMQIFGSPSEFRENDLERIRKKEEGWLRQANHIFWTSNWAKRDGAKYEDLTNGSEIIVGVGGNLVPPSIVGFSGEQRLLFISLRFREKGGMEAFKAFVKLQKKIPELKFVVIGESPPDWVSAHPGVEALGLLNKSNPDDLARLQHELERAFCLIHPTRMDTMGCVLIEAAYWGCPSIAPARFGIPEIIENRVTGLLLPDPFTVDHIVNLVETMLGNEDEYLKMRAAARIRALESFTYDVIADKIISSIDASLSG